MVGGKAEGALEIETAGAFVEGGLLVLSYGFVGFGGDVCKEFVGLSGG